MDSRGGAVPGRRLQHQLPRERRLAGRVERRGLVRRTNLRNPGRITIGITDVTIPDHLYADAEDIDEETTCVNNLRDWLEDEPQHNRALLEELSSLDEKYRPRALRALRGFADGSDLLESLPLDALGPSELYRLIQCLDASDSTQRKYLRDWSRHPVDWVAGNALETLVEHPRQNEKFLNERLIEENRQPVLVALLKALLTAPGPSFERGLESIISSPSNSTVLFYAATLLKQRSPERFDQLAGNSPYLRQINERVSVGSPPPGEQ